MASTTQDMRYRLSLIQYAEKFGVTKAAGKYKTDRQYIYRWIRRYDGFRKFLRKWKRTFLCLKAGSSEILGKLTKPGKVSQNSLDAGCLTVVLFRLRSKSSLLSLQEDTICCWNARISQNPIHPRSL